MWRADVQGVLNYKGPGILPGPFFFGGMMKKVEVYTPSAPAHGNAKQWVRNRNVWVVVHENGFGCINSPSIIERHCIATEVDSRYTGGRSAYGQALQRANKLARKLKIKIVKADPLLALTCADSEMREFAGKFLKRKGSHAKEKECVS
jgi:hypothetical protein